MRLARLAAVIASIAAAFVLGGCGRGRFVPPTVAPTPFPDGAVAWRAATATCGAMSTYRAELRVDGRLFGPSVILAVALDAVGHVALDARVAGTSVFTLRGSSESATLVLPDRQQFVTARPEDILDAIVGVSIGPRRLLAVLTGCLSVTRDASAIDLRGRVLRATVSDGEVYLARVDDEWRVRAGTFDGVWVDYRDMALDGPRRLSLRAADEARSELTLVVAASDTIAVPPAQFVATVPSSFTPLTLPQLRTDGPFARR